MKASATGLEYYDEWRRRFLANYHRYCGYDAGAAAARLEEIRQLIPAQVLLRHQDILAVLAPAEQIPALFSEIACLRAAGGGEYCPRNGDEPAADPFDDHYIQLLLWDLSAHRIVGACRLGITDRIIKQYGRRGLWTDGLFKYRKNLLARLHGSIEVGAFFTRREIPSDALAPYLLWKSIAR